MKRPQLTLHFPRKEGGGSVGITPCTLFKYKLFIFSSVKSGYRKCVFGGLPAGVLLFWPTALREKESAGACLGPRIRVDIFLSLPENGFRHPFFRDTLSVKEEMFQGQ